MAALLILPFMAAQGAAVFVTAWLGLRFLPSSGERAKFCAMALSYSAWIAFTIGGYAALGGDFGLFDGFGLVLSLCGSTLVSSVIYLLVWVAMPRPREMSRD